MIDLTKETEWLQEWVNDPAHEGGTDLEKRTFTAFEVEMIMNIHAHEKVKESQVNAYIKRCGYTWSYVEILKAKKKHEDGYYISHTALDVINSCFKKPS